jgi:toxin YoeB
MSYSIDYPVDVQKVIKKWKKSNPDAFKKLYKILPELEQHPRIGTGHPEAMKGCNDITWSRRITAHDRIIYDIYDDVVTVLIVEVEGHYNDK